MKFVSFDFQLSLYLNLLLFLGRFIFLFLAAFLFWGKLKEDYPDEQILSLTLAVIFFGYLGLRLGLLVGCFLFVVATTLIFCRIQKLKWWPIADALVFPLLIFGLGTALLNLAVDFSWVLLFPPLLFFLVLLGSVRMEKTYRSVAWYKSGKIGFIFYFAIIAFFSLFLVLEIATGKPLYWQILVEALVVLTAAFLLYLRANEDQKEKNGFLLKISKIFKKTKNGQNSIS